MLCACLRHLGKKDSLRPVPQVQGKERPCRHVRRPGAREVQVQPVLPRFWDGRALIYRCQDGHVSFSKDLRRCGMKGCANPAEAVSDLDVEWFYKISPEGL